jgi:hypothetical protein
VGRGRVSLCLIGMDGGRGERTAEPPSVDIIVDCLVLEAGLFEFYEVFLLFCQKKIDI